MSSFVINKRAYVRACGCLAGLAETPEQRFFQERAFRLWNYSKGRVYTADDFMQAAKWLYHLNAVSVMKQYGDDQAEHDAGDYSGDFDEYKVKAAAAYRHGGEKLQKMVFELNRFFQSALYQIEDPECERAAKGFIYRAMFQLNDTVSTRAGFETENWGDFEIA